MLNYIGAQERDLIKITAENNINISGDKIRDYTRNGNVFIIEKNGKVNNADIIAECNGKIQAWKIQGG